MDKIVDHNGDRLALDTDTGRRFVSDMARYADGTLTETMIRKRWQLDDAAWERLGQDDALVYAIENEKLARIADGRTKRERAQQLVIAGPNVLSDVMLNDKFSARHRIDAAKVLNEFASTNGPQDAPANGTVFNIRIDLTAGGGEVLEFEKTLTAAPNNENSDSAPQGLLPAITTNKQNGGSDGEPV